MSIGKRSSILVKLATVGVVIVGVVEFLNSSFSLRQYLKPDRESYQEIVTRNQNPTNVVLAELGVKHILGDQGSSLVAKYQNETDMPALAFSVKASLGSEELPELNSAIYKIVDRATLIINPKKSLEMPIVPISMLEERIGGNICGVGLRPIDLGATRPENCPSGGFCVQLLSISQPSTRRILERRRS